MYKSFRFITLILIAATIWAILAQAGIGYLFAIMAVAMAFVTWGMGHSPYKRAYRSPTK